MFEKIKIFGERPTGNCLFVTCDLIYFKKFYSKIQESYYKELSGFDSFHCHVICPEAKVGELWCNDSKENCTISYELTSDVAKILENINFEERHWLNINDKLVREMLLAESYRKSGLKSFLFGRIKRLSGISELLIDRLSPLKFVNETKLKTYYALRRFLMPESFFSHVTGLLVTDIDSHFQSPLQFSEIDYPMSKAISRNGMWSRYMAGFVFFKFESIGYSASIVTLNELIHDLIKKQGLHWGLDQIALDSLAERNLLSPIDSIRYSFSRDCDEDAIFVSLKGPSKWS